MPELEDERVKKNFFKTWDFEAPVHYEGQLKNSADFWFF